MQVWTLCYDSYRSYIRSYLFIELVFKLSISIHLFTDIELIKFCRIYINIIQLFLNFTLYLQKMNLFI